VFWGCKVSRFFNQCFFVCAQNTLKYCNLPCGCYPTQTSGLRPIPTYQICWV
jgi:hypothetical protein